jgi:hypothetical protein
MLIYISPLNNYTTGYKLNKLVRLSSYTQQNKFTWPKDLLVIGVYSKATKMCDIEMNLHNNLKDNQDQLEHIYICYS